MQTFIEKQWKKRKEYVFERTKEYFKKWEKRDAPNGMWERVQAGAME